MMYDKLETYTGSTSAPREKRSVVSDSRDTIRSDAAKAVSTSAANASA